MVEIPLLSRILWQVIPVMLVFGVSALEGLYFHHTLKKYHILADMGIFLAAHVVIWLTSAAVTFLFFRFLYSIAGLSGEMLTLLNTGFHGVLSYLVQMAFILIFYRDRKPGVLAWFIPLFAYIFISGMNWLCFFLREYAF
jgi:hypothetical protein